MLFSLKAFISHTKSCISILKLEWYSTLSTSRKSDWNRIDLNALQYIKAYFPLSKKHENIPLVLKSLIMQEQS